MLKTCHLAEMTDDIFSERYFLRHTFIRVFICPLMLFFDPEEED